MKTIWTGDIGILTPCFCRGAYQDTPEMRVPSIRGMVRWWFRILGGSSQEEKQIFGGMKKFAEGEKGKVMASRVVFRVPATNTTVAKPNPFTLPHKEKLSAKQASPQAAFSEGGAFRLEIFSLHESLDAGLEQKLVTAIEVWMLLGALGLRANRAGGSLWPLKDAPTNSALLRKRLTVLGCNWPLYLAGDEAGKTLAELRSAATDTLNGYPMVFGSVRPRQASTIKIKVICLDQRLRLLITAPESGVLEEAKKLLAKKRIYGDTWQAI
jgi:CRISPR type III-B/RAMP module RAMP protein Cmr1